MRLKPSWSLRSISACAEETVEGHHALAGDRVDLRVRGGDDECGRGLRLAGGRSPRARRRRSSPSALCTSTGSISACAEETYEQ